MKHIVMIWGANFSSEEELGAFVEFDYDEDGDALPSVFMSSIGVSWIDDDFLETHFLNNEEERMAFTEYLLQEYSPHESFAEQLLALHGRSSYAYNSIILLYGSDSPYGAVNDVLFQIAEAGRPAASSVDLLARIVYETKE